MLKLKQKIMELEYELSIKNKELELKLNEIHRLSSTPGSYNPQQDTNYIVLEQENNRLRSDIERMKMKNQGMSMESGDLLRKIQELEQYIANLKRDLDKDIEEMQSMER